MKRRWTKEEANEWYSKLGWLRGCNFIGSDCANRLDMWQSYKSEEKLATAERELALAQKIGFNFVRLWANFDVYYAEPDSYFKIFEKYIALCDKYGQKVMVVLSHEEDRPRGESFVPKEMGEQKYALGEHQGRFPLTPEQKALTPYHYLEYPELKEIFLTMVRETVRRYARDERIIVWNVINEPGMFLGDRVRNILPLLFDTVRAEDPMQPLCADIWHKPKDGKLANEVDELSYELSDIISLHSYSPYETLVTEIAYHRRKSGRPIFLTEWLLRITGSNVAEIYPLLWLENIANACWGFVVGKTQTNEPWDIMWKALDEGRADNYDFSKWMHDLFRPNLRPYDPKEIALIEKFNALAKEEGR